jgi:hypothetical protein
MQTVADQNVADQNVAPTTILDLQTAFFDRDIRPDEVQELVLGDDPVAPFNQRHEQVERARADLSRLALDHEPAPRRFNDNPPETLLEGRPCAPPPCGPFACSARQF